MILIATSTAFTRALSDVPIISSQVTSRAIIAAGRLIKPPGWPPSTSGPALSHAGKSIPNDWVSTVSVK